MPKTLFGLHGRADGRLQPADLECIQTAKVQAVKLMSSAAYEDVDSILGLDPTIFILVRLYADMTSRALKPADFVASVAVDLNGFYAKGVRYFEIGNEPNVFLEGMGRSWMSGNEYASWFREVYGLLKASRPEAQFGWPGLSPGPDSPERFSESNFLAEAGQGPQGSDWIGVHCYWQGEGDLLSRQGGNHYLDYRDRYPGKKIFITEFSNPQPGVNPTDKGNQYVRYWKQLIGVGAAFAFVSSASSGFAGEAWRDESGRLSPIASIVGQRAVDERARGIDASGLYQKPDRMRFDDWRELGFCFGFYEVSIGLSPTPFARELRQGLRQAGYLTGHYQALHESYSAQEQCKLFIDAYEDNELPGMVDIERVRLPEARIHEWCDYYDAHCTRPLLIYTGYWVWKRLVAAVDTPRYAPYGLYVGQYPFDSPSDSSRPFDNQPMEADAVSRRSNPPDQILPNIPAPWSRYEIWQHSGHGSLPGYDGFLDLDVFNGSEDLLRARYTAFDPAASLGSAAAGIQAVLAAFPK